MKKWMSRMIVAFASIAMVISLLNVSGIEAQAAVKKPTSITLTTTNKTVDINGKVTVSVKAVKPVNASKAVTYKSSNKNVATVSAKGVVTGKKAGTVTITATSKVNTKIKGTIKITVKDIKPTGLTLNISKASGYMGATKTIKATVKPAYSSQKVYYSTSNKKVATVTSAGKVTYVGPGEATITVRTGQKNKYGNYIKKTVKVTVNDRANASINWQYMTPEELFGRLDNEENLTVLDIRPEKIDGTAVGYADGHIEGSLWVPSWPVDTIAKQNALRTTQVLSVLKDNKAPVVIVCRSGASGAKRAISVLKGFEGIDASRMFILEGGGTALINNYSDKLVKGVEDFTGKYVISPAELKAKMDAGEKLKLVDTRGINAKTATIKGAITMVWQQISRSPMTDGTKSGEAGFARTLSAAKISTALSALGLGKNDQIILFSDGYATGGWGDDGRVLWQLQQCGYTNVKMLNGGVSAMKAECGSSWKNYSQTGPSKAVKKTVKVTTVNQGLNGITTANLLNLYKNKADFKVIDVRANAEFEGQILYGEKSGGHLKDALHIRFTDLFRVDGTLKSVSELTKMFEAAGLEKDDKIVTYCTGGIRSAYMQLVLEMCGFENSFNYAESAYRWANTKSAGTANYWTKLCNLTEIEFAEDDLTLSCVGASDKLTVILTPMYTTETYSFSTSDKAVATVDKNGVVTAMGYGKAVITVKSSKTGKKDTVEVEIKAPEAVEEKQVFVSPEYVKAAIDGQLPESENLLVAEVSWGAYASASAYAKAHIPGAVHINSDAVEYDDCDPWPYGDGIDDLAQYGDEYHYGANPVDPEDNFNIRSAEQLAQFMKIYGITQDTNVILYGSSASNSAVTRVAFAMIYAGVDNVKVVDGGFAAWKEAGLPTETTIHKPAATTEDFGVTIPEHPEYIMSIEEVQDNLENNKNFNLVSIRSRDEFEGKTSGYGYIDFAGEPEGAIWGKDTDDGTYVQNGKIADISALKQYVAEGGGSYDNELSFYCGTGWRATIPFLMAYQDGKEDISLYDGGWWLWTVKQKEEASKYPVQTITPEQAARFASISFEKDVVEVNESETAVANDLVIKYQRTDLKVSYASDNDAVASVDEEGNVTIKGDGKAVITASVEGDERTASYTINVNNAVE